MTTIHEAGFPNRAIHAFDKAGKFQTVEEIVKAKDEDLMKVKNLGRKTVEQIRSRLAEIRMEKATAFVPETSGLEWAKRHVNLIRSIITGEVVIRPK